METEALATEPDTPDYLAGMFNDLDRAVKSFNKLEAKTDEVLERIDEAMQRPRNYQS